MENNEKKKVRIWGRRFFGEQAIILISVAFVLCMFNFTDMALGLKWWFLYSVLIFCMSGLISGLLQWKDIKEMISNVNPMKK